MAQPRTILIAEDDPDDRHLVLAALAAAGINNPIEAAENGRSAIQILESGRVPVLALLDIKMPQADGFEVLRWIRSRPRLARVPVIMLSGSALPGDLEGAAQLGANAFLVKPSSYETLVAMMKAIKDFWLTFHQQPPTLSS